MDSQKLPDSLFDLLKGLKENKISRESYKHEIDRYLSFKARKYAIPYSGTFELTPLCNLDCKMCYVHLRRKQMKGNCLLSVEQWKKLIRQAKCAGMRDATLTGGECLTYPGFDEVYLYLQSFGIDVTVFTNGILLDEKRIRFFQEHPPLGIQITLYGSCNEAYEKVTGHREFDRVWKNINLAKDAKLPLYMAVTPSAFMENDAEALLEKIQFLGISSKINTSLFDPREDTGRAGQSLDASLDTYVKLYKMDRAFYGREVVPVEEVNLPVPGGKANSPKGLRCAAGRSSFEINWQGKMFACTNLPMICADPFQKDFLSSWKKINEIACQFEMPIECEKCIYQRICVSCPAPHLKNGSAAHCNSYFCDRIKRLVKEGIYLLPSE